MGCIEDRTPGIDDDVPIRGEGVEADAERLADSAPGPVSYHGAAEGARGREPETRPGLRGVTFGTKTERCEERA